MQARMATIRKRRRIAPSCARSATRRRWFWKEESRSRRSLFSRPSSSGTAMPAAISGWTMASCRKLPAASPGREKSFPLVIKTLLSGTRNDDERGKSARAGEQSRSGFLRQDQPAAQRCRRQLTAKGAKDAKEQKPSHRRGSQRTQRNHRVFFASVRHPFRLILKKSFQGII